ncbi:uncharacterized protein LOC142591341 [Dermacentor variabilis]|uniref:uncharacterized protein LOC142591341 n=1 Tax=Dermacentor variabilis TaxID=34621 RepID=UPI003F5C0EBB
MSRNKVTARERSRTTIAGRKSLDSFGCTTLMTAFLGNIDLAVLARIVYAGGSGPVCHVLRRGAVICSSARVAVFAASLVTPVCGLHSGGGPLSEFAARIVHVRCRYVLVSDGSILQSLPPDSRRDCIQHCKNGIRKFIATSNIKASCEPGLEINGAFYIHGFPVIGLI